MNEKKLKIKSIFNCPVCVGLYDESRHRPLLMPCGKTICQQCIDANLTIDRSFWCPFCCQYHKPHGQKNFPLNDALLYLIKHHETDTQRTQESSTSGLSNCSGRIKDAMDEIRTNSVTVDNEIHKSAQILNKKFTLIEDEINQRVETMIEEIKLGQAELIKELEKHHQKLLSLENPVLRSRHELKISKSKLLEAISNPQIDDDQNLSILTQAEDLNKRLIRLKDELSGWASTELKLEKPQTENVSIGRIVLDLNESLSQKANVKFKPNTNQTQTHSYIPFKIPSKSRNFLIGVLTESSLIKLNEFTDIEDLSFRLGVQIVDKSGFPINSKSFQLDSFRLKRLETSPSNGFAVVLLRNHFCNLSKRLLLINSNLDLVSRIDLSQTVSGLFMNESLIYVLNKNGPTNIYAFNEPNFELKLAKNVISTHKWNIVGVYDAKLYCLDFEMGKVRLFDESNAEVKTWFHVNLDSDNNESSWLVRVDSIGRLNMVNRNSFQLRVYDKEGAFVLERKFDSSRLKSVDILFTLSANRYSIVDLKNKFIHFF